MKDIYEVLRQKELELSRLEIEVEALRVAAPLLSDGKKPGTDNNPALVVAPQQPIRKPKSGVDATPEPVRASGGEGTPKGWP
jgi:hypothetical protein